MNAPLQADVARIDHEAPAMWLRRLWERMVSLYGHAWVNVHGVTPHEGTGALSMSGSTWGGALAGLTGQQIAEGLKACIAIGGEFPPNVPRFRALCLSIPTLDAVKFELENGDPTPFTRAVLGRLDVFRYKQASAEHAEKLLAGAYRLAHDAVMRGEALPAAPVAVIEHEVRKPVPATREQSAAHIARIQALLHGDGP